MRADRRFDGHSRELKCRVLVVDDEPALLRVFRRMLEPLYEVVTAACPLSALDALIADVGFDAIVCDVRMPVMTGPVLHDTIKSRWPLLADRFIFVTATPHEALACGVPVLAKPVTSLDLLD